MRSAGAVLGGLVVFVVLSIGGNWLVRTLHVREIGWAVTPFAAAVAALGVARAAPFLPWAHVVAALFLPAAFLAEQLYRWMSITSGSLEHGELVLLVALVVGGAFGGLVGWSMRPATPVPLADDDPQ